MVCQQSPPKMVFGCGRRVMLPCVLIATFGIIWKWASPKLQLFPRWSIKVAVQRARLLAALPSSLLASLSRNARVGNACAFQSTCCAWVRCFVAFRSVTAHSCAVKLCRKHLRRAIGGLRLSTHNPLATRSTEALSKIWTNARRHDPLADRPNIGPVRGMQIAQTPLLHPLEVKSNSCVSRNKNTCLMAFLFFLHCHNAFISRLTLEPFLDPTLPICPSPNARFGIDNLVGNHDITLEQSGAIDGRGERQIAVGRRQIMPKALL